MTTARRGYHHGDLHDSVLAEALSIVRESGIDTLSIRKVTRRVGVAPNAAYRHFADRDALVAEVAREVQDVLAERMRTAIQPTQRTSPSTPRAQLVAIARIYVAFAVDEPAWFDALCRGQAHRATRSRSTGDVKPSPHELLQSVLVDVGATETISKRRARDAIWMIWAALDGTSRLASAGPLQSWPRPKLDHFVSQMITAVLDGLGSDPH